MHGGALLDLAVPAGQVAVGAEVEAHQGGDVQPGEGRDVCDRIALSGQPWLGGKLLVDSREGEGTRITVLLPLMESASDSDLHRLEQA